MNASLLPFMVRKQFDEAAGIFHDTTYRANDGNGNTNLALISNGSAVNAPGSRKRGPEELLSPLSNGATMSPQPTTLDNDAKKAKLDTTATRSRVVHLRNVPPDISDVELLHLCIPFGKVNNFLLLKGKSQAFVEYEDETSAFQLVSISSTCPINLRGRTIFCQFSNHQELKVDKQSVVTNNMVPGIGNIQACFGSGAATMFSNESDIHAAVAQSLIATQTQQQPNSVLRVIIENLLYPVSLDILHQIFSRFGKVLRIITFNKNSTFQALVQYSESISAQLAKTALDSQNVYNGCCTLRIDYSKLTTLNVKYNNDKSRDYTNPHLPSGDLALDHTLGLANLGLLTGAAGMLSAAGPSLTAGAQALHNPLTGATLPFGNAATFAATSNALQQHHQAQQQQQQQHALQQAAAAAVSAGNFYCGGALNLPGLTLAASNNGLTGITGLRLPAQLAALSITPVVLVSNLNEEKVTCDALFTLFGVYGDVQRVKILFNKKDNALIQFAESQQAQHAAQNLDKAKLWGKVIRVASSKHMNVQMPKEGQPDAGLTKDYSQSSLHRFKKPGSKNYMNIYPPSATLHLSNIPPNITEEFLMEAFSEAGFSVKAFKFFPKDHKMALVQLGSVDEALVALIAMHNHKLAENAHLRVSFSKSGI